MTVPVVAIDYDLGAAGPMEIVRAARGVCEPLFVVDLASPHCAEMLPVLQRSATVCDVTGLDDDAAAAALVARHSPAGVTTFCEYRIGHAAHIGRALGLPAHSPSTVAALTDKHAQRNALARAGLDVPRHIAVSDPGELAAAVAELGPPVVVKPRHGAGSVDTYVVWPDELTLPGAYQAPAVGRAVVEKMLVGDPTVAGPDWGDYVSVESVVRGGIPTHIGVIGKFPLTEPLRETGFIFPSTLTPADLPTVTDTADRALAAVGFADGACHVEIKLTAAGPRVIEINGRMGGSVSDIIERSSGACFLRAALSACAGRQVDVPATGGALPVAFSYFVLPPAWATRIAALGDTAAIRRIPGVSQVRLARAVGDAVSWRDGTPGRVATVRGAAATHSGVLEVIGQVNATLDIRYTCD
jgi:biotin carboxylase